MNVSRVFVVEDNTLIRDSVSEYFQVNGFEVLPFERAQGVLDALGVSRPDVIILDIMLPDMSGYMLAQQIRAHSSVPIIFLTAREEESDRVMGFEVGGDDYVVKPFSTKELYLRTRAILRRLQSDNSAEREHGTWRRGGDVLTVDTKSRRALLNDKDISLTNAEWQIMTYLAFREGRAISRQQILGECLGYHVEGSERTVDTHIANIRSALGNPDWIETVRAFGYRFVPEAKE